jgi:anti-sigma factor RsiW
MSPQLHYETTHALKQQTPAPVQAHRVANTNLVRRSVRSRVGQAVAAFGVCLAAATAVTVTGAQASSHLTPASQMNREIRAFEASGYVPFACTRQGTLMRNSNTGRFVTARW